MLSGFKKFVADNNLIDPGDKILLAVSGGIDSMVMAHLFLSFPNEKGIAHCNFSLRGKESDEDENLVREFAESHKIPFYTIKFDTRMYARNKGLSIQMAARELRYTWFEELRIEKGYDSVAVAHNLNDNIETLIINLVRGTGLAGLTGIRPVSNRIIRPVLFATREMITNYCNQNGVQFREDRSNADTHYIRNKIRHLVVPVLKEINPSIESTLSETAERFTGINELVSEFITKLRDKISEKREGAIIYNYTQLKQHLGNKTTLFELFKPYGITNVQLDDLMKVIQGKTGGRIHTNTHRIIKNRKEIIVSVAEDKTEATYIINNIDDFMNVPGIESASYVAIENFDIPLDPSSACLDSEKVSFPMVIRKWKAGDYFYPFGMKQKKKLSDYFIDRKYSILDKENKLILESDEKIVWIIGDRIDNRFRITKHTKKALLIRSRKKALVIKRLK
jgi:tRNA(Ile)-lysidine synthase